MACGSPSCCGLETFASTEFEKLETCKVDGTIPITKYISKSTGLIVVHADVEGPLVHGFICVATRVDNDDGLPHTLEHMIFLGSESYPYPGMLDQVANKCFASGTNAWTDVDHTCYTLSTAGSEGFCKILPIYMDHVYYPLLTEAAFKTEVYHVTGSGTDAGVVYSEMQALENTAFCKATESLYKTLFTPASGYYWNTGGTLFNLRESCSNQKVKEYHKKYYHPRNTCVIVCGKIEPKDIFKALYRPIKKENSKNEKSHSETPQAKFEQPWLNETQRIYEPKDSSEITVPFPAMEEEGGCVCLIGFLSGSDQLVPELEEACGLELILRYLSKSSGSPLQQAFVEKEGALATSFSFTVAAYSRTLVYFEMEGIDPKNRGKIVPQLKKTFQEQINNFDMAGMTNTIKSGIQLESSALEKNPAECIAQAVISDFIYSLPEQKNGEESSFRMRLNRISTLEKLHSKPASFWTEMIREKILDKNWVTVFAEPSTFCCYELQVELEDRIGKRLGNRRGLADNARQLDEAILLNSKPVPKRVLKKVKVPSMKCIQYHSIDRIQNPEWIYHTDFPANICLDDIQTNFVHVYLIMDTSELENSFRKYLPAFKEVLLNSPILDDSGKQIIPFDEVVADRSRYLLACEINTGLEITDFSCAEESPTPRFSCGSFSHVLTLSLQMELDNVEHGIEWTRKILWRAKWQKDRIKVAINKLRGETLTLKRSGCRMCQAIIKYMVYDKDGNVAQSNLLTQIKFLSSLAEDDDSTIKNNENEIWTAFDSILNVITDANNVSLHIAASMKKVRNKLDLTSVGNLSTALKRAFPFELCPTGGCHPRIERRIAKILDSTSMLSPETLRKRSDKNRIIYGLGGEESAYLIIVGPGLTSYQSEDLAALLTLLQYFNQQDGPIANKVRGRGFAYSYHSALRVNEGLIYFYLSMCSDLLGAYDSVLRVVAEHMSKSLFSMWSNPLLVSAKSSLIFECLSGEKTPLSLASSSCLSYYRDVPGTFARTLLKKIAKVKMRHLKSMMVKYFAPMFRPGGSYATVVVCPTEQVDPIKEGFAKLGRKMNVFKSYDSLMTYLSDEE